MRKVTYLFAAFITCISIGFQAYAQQPNPESAKHVPSDESQAILKQMQKKWHELQAVRINFTLQTVKKEKVTGTIKGTLWSKGNSYKLTIPDQIIYCDGKSTWNFLPSNNEVSINPCEESESEFALNPLKIINNYEKYYRSAFIKETAEKGIAIQIIDLYPKQKQSFYKIRMVIQKDKLWPLRISVHEQDGSVDTYYFDQITPNPKLTESFFQFDSNKYPQVEIIDMR